MINEGGDENINIQERIRIGAVSYLNSNPLVYGMQQGAMKDEIILSFDYPSNITTQFLNGQIDVALLPTAVLPKLKEYFLVSDYGIACKGAVASVCLFSDVPISKITHILLDYQSKTSVELLKILLNSYWKINIPFTQTNENYEIEIKDNIAGLVIGNRAFVQRLKSKYVYDLGEAWLAFTGLPFVFATWVSNKKMSKNFIEKFNAANKIGITNLDKIIAINNYAHYNLMDYYTKNIKYLLQENEWKGLDKFLKLNQKINL